MAYPILTVDENVLLREIKQLLAIDDAYWADGGGCDTGAVPPDTNRLIRVVLHRFRQGKVVDRRPLETLSKLPIGALASASFKSMNEVLGTAPAFVVTRHKCPAFVLMSCAHYAAVVAGAQSVQPAPEEPADATAPPDQEPTPSGAADAGPAD